MSTNKTTVIESAEYTHAVEALIKRPEVLKMAVAVGNITWDEMGSVSFMIAANEEARKRGVPSEMIPYIGSTARAIEVLLSRGVDPKHRENSTGPADMQHQHFLSKVDYAQHMIDTLTEQGETDNAVYIQMYTELRDEAALNAEKTKY